MLFESLLVYKQLNPAAISEVVSLAGSDDSELDYFRVLALDLGLQQQAVEQVDIAGLRSLIASKASPELAKLLDGLLQPAVKVSSMNVSRAIAVARKLLMHRLSFGNPHMMPAQARHLNLESLKILSASAGVGLMLMADVYGVSETGEHVAKVNSGEMFSSGGQIRNMLIAGEVTQMLLVKSEDGQGFYVPAFCVLLLEKSMLRTASDKSLPQILTKMNILDLVNLQYRLQASRSLIGLSDTGLGLRQERLQAENTSVLTLANMNMRSANGSFLLTIPEGTEVIYTGKKLRFGIGKLAVDFLEVSCEIDGKVQKGYVMSFGLALKAPLTTFGFVDERFSYKYDVVPSNDEVDDLRHSGFKMRLPMHLEKAGLVLAYSDKFQEYFVYSKKHLLSIDRQTLRYLRYKKEYLESSFEAEFASYALFHGNVRGYGLMNFKFEALADLDLCRNFDTKMLKSLNDLLDELEDKEKQEALQSFIENESLRFYYSDPLRPMAKEDLTKQLAGDTLEKMSRDLDGRLHMNLKMSEKNRKKSKVNIKQQEHVLHALIR